MNNKVLGNKFEEDFAQFLSEKGYWVAPFPGKAFTNSQPADLIACKNNVPYLIDCKTLSNKNGLFALTRVEQNQRLAYKRFRECGNFLYTLAILWNNDIYMIPLYSVNFKNKNINLKEINPQWKGFYNGDTSR